MGLVKLHHRRDHYRVTNYYPSVSGMIGEPL